MVTEVPYDDMARIARIEMAVFDQLPKCVRDVVNNAPLGVRVFKMVQKPGNQRLIKEDPELFASLLKKEIKRQTRLLANV